MASLTINRIGVVFHELHPHYPLDHLREILAAAGIEVIPLTPTEGPACAEPAQEPVDLILALGGDGTVLKALCAYPQVPVLAINFGSLGFLTAGEHHDLDQILHQLLKGDYFVEERLVLRVLRHDQTQHDVINEVVVRGVTKMVSVDIWVDDRFVHTVRGDGVIVGTPTGSTSYLLSTGASIVSPTLECVILSGINEHRFASRSIVLPPASTVRLAINPDTREEHPFMVLDGRDHYPMVCNEPVEVTRSPVRARLVFFNQGYFLTNLKSRLDW